MLLNLFPNSVLLDNLNVDKNKVLNLLKKEKYEHRKSVDPYQNTQSYSGLNYNILNKSKVLKKEILKTINRYCEEVLHIDNKMDIYSSWATKHTPNGHSSYHYHSNSYISGVYYPIGNKGFKISFLNPLQKVFDTIPNKYTMENSDSWEITASDNLVIIFPSYLKHSVLKNTSSQDRYSLAFNCMPKGKFGVGDSLHEF